MHSSAIGQQLPLIDGGYRPEQLPEGKYVSRNVRGESGDGIAEKWQPFRVITHLIVEAVV